MKKLLLGSILLTFFSFAIILFQISCRKEASARNMGEPLSTSILISKPFVVKFSEQSGVDSLNNPILEERSLTALDFYILQDNETVLNKVTVNLPQDEYAWSRAVLSKDGSKIFFDTYHIHKGYSGIYSCSVDGGNAKKIADENYSLHDAY
jgi:hypothetical protein